MNKRIKKKKFKNLDRKLDKILKQAFSELANAEEGSDEDCFVEFSKEHKEKMNKLFESLKE